MSRLFLTLLVGDVVHRITYMKRFPCLLTDCHWNGTVNPVLCFLNPHEIFLLIFRSLIQWVNRLLFSRLQVKVDGWNPLQPLGASKEVSKSKRNGADLAKSNRKAFSSHWGLHNKKHGKVCPQLPPIFPLPQCLIDAGIAGDTVEAILYRVEVIDIPSSVSHISLLCGTNNLSSDSPATSSSTITELLFLLRRKCPTANIHLFPKTHFASTNSCNYFQVQEFFSGFVFFFPRAPIHPI